MTTKEKLFKFIKFKRITKKKFYDITNLSNGFLDSGKHIGTDKLKIIIEHFPDLNINWLVLDEGDMIKEVDNEFQLQEERYQNKLIIESLENHIKILNNLITDKERLLSEKERIISTFINRDTQHLIKTLKETST